MSPPQRQKTLVVLSQVYPPDPASVGQHMADVAEEMVRRGWRVVVLTSRRGYTDPSIKYSKRELRHGVHVVRLPLSSFGKKHMLLRAAAALLFMLQLIVRVIFSSRIDCLLVSTSPPMCIVAAIAIRLFRRVPIKFWVMDINPDQLVALGAIRPRSMPARLMDCFNRVMLRRASDVVVLDRFMGNTMLNKLDVREKVRIIPPWPHEDHIDSVPHDQNPFRREQGLDGKFVFMYSGNHGIALPLDTFIQAAVRFRDHPRAVFMFIGDGVRKREVEQAIREHGMRNMRSLPYQSLENLKYSLSAADVHLVTIGDGMVGIIHPCKVYGAMAAGRPILLVGPQPSHVSELISRYDFGWHVPHGNVDAVERVIAQIIDTEPGALAEMGERARMVIRSHLSKDTLCGALCDVLEGSANFQSDAHRIFAVDSR